MRSEPQLRLAFLRGGGSSGGLGAPKLLTPKHRSCKHKSRCSNRPTLCVQNGCARLLYAASNTQNRARRVELFTHPFGSRATFAFAVGDAAFDFHRFEHAFIEA